MSGISQYVKGLSNGNPLGVTFLNYISGDQTSYINDLLQVVSDGGGGEVVLDKGVWTADIEIPDNITLSGFGFNLTEINPTTTTGVQKVIKNKDQVSGNVNITVRNLVVDAGRTAGAVGGGGNVDFQIIQNLRVENVTSKNAYSHCFEFGHFDNIFISNCHGVFESSYDADDCFSFSDGFRLAGARRSVNATVIGCTGTGFPTRANTSGFEVDDAPQNVTFLNCNTYGTYNGFLVHVHDGDVSPTDIKVIGCVSDEAVRGFSVYQRESPDNIKNIFFTDCTAKGGGGSARGFYTDNLSSPTYELGLILFNNCVSSGNYQGLINNGEYVNIIGCDFVDNTVPYQNTYNANQLATTNRPTYPLS